MFGSISHLALQKYWWIIISLLAGFLVFLMFVQGGQMLIYRIGKTDTQRTLIINAMGRKWEFTFTTLVTFGGAFFASFPLFYATSFGGAYWAWMALLFCFVIQAVSYHYRKKPSNFLGERTYEVFLFINGFLGTILVGMVVGTFFNGSEFLVNEFNQSEWIHPARGLEVVLNLHNLTLGLTVFFLSRVLGSLYLMNSVEDEEIRNHSKKQVLFNGLPFVIFFLVFVIWLLLKKGFAYDPETFIVYEESFKYWHNLLQMPINTLIFFIGVVLVLWGIGGTLLKDEWNKGIWPAGLGTILTVFALFLLAGFNNTCYYPSIYDLQSSLHIQNSSSSKFTLSAMSIVSLMLPFVLAYIWWAWKAINRTKITSEEMYEEESHVY